MQLTFAISMEDARSQVRSGQRCNPQMRSDGIALFRIDVSSSFSVVQRDRRLSKLS